MSFACIYKKIHGFYINALLMTEIFMCCSYFLLYPRAFKNWIFEYSWVYLFSLTILIF